MEELKLKFSRIQEQQIIASKGLAASVSSKSRIQTHVLMLKNRLRSERLLRSLFSCWRSWYLRRKKGISIIISTLQSKRDEILPAFFSLLKHHSKQINVLNIIFQKLFFTVKKQKVLQAWRKWSAESSAKTNSLYSQNLEISKRNCKTWKEKIKLRHQNIIAEVFY